MWSDPVAATRLLGIMLGPLVAWVGVRVGAHRFDRRGPELLAALRRT
ncbi:MAG: hypothetical protein ABI336_06980 [Humibacillus sp.]